MTIMKKLLEYIASFLIQSLHNMNFSLRILTIIFLAGLLHVPSLAHPSVKDYIVGEGDVLKITVYAHPDLTTTSRIEGDGAILFPLIGQVRVAGLTISGVSDKISELLADGYVISPQVTIFIEEFRSQKATIMGQVNKPGLYELKGHTTFLEILSRAGDLSKDAGDKAVVKRKTTGTDASEKIIVIDIKKLIEMGDISQNIPILDGDNLYVVKAGLFYVTGEVKRPDAYKHENGTSVIMALTRAGGFTDKASTGRVRIIRKVEGREIIINKVKMDEPVLPEDVIVVPESFF